MKASSNLQSYASQDTLVRLAFKIGNCTPEQLPPHLRSTLMQVLSDVEELLVHGLVRPGCTHLLFDLWLPRGQLPLPQLAAGGGGRHAVGPSLEQRLSTLAGDVALVQLASPGQLASVLGRRLLDRCDITVQAGCSVTRLPAGGAAAQELALPAALPLLVHAAPAALLHEGGCATLTIYGTQLGASGVQIFVRHHGRYLDVEHCEAVPEVEASALLAGCHALRVHVRGAPAPGLAAVELQFENVLR